MDGHECSNFAKQSKSYWSDTSLVDDARVRPAIRLDLSPFVPQLAPAIGKQVAAVAPIERVVHPSFM